MINDLYDQYKLYPRCRFVEKITIVGLIISEVSHSEFRASYNEWQLSKRKLNKLFDETYSADIGVKIIAGLSQASSPANIRSYSSSHQAYISSTAEMAKCRGVFFCAISDRRSLAPFWSHNVGNSQGSTVVARSESYSKGPDEGGISESDTHVLRDTNSQSIPLIWQIAEPRVNIISLLQHVNFSRHSSVY